MDGIVYKDFIIETAPELHDGKWSTNVWIRIHLDKGPSGRGFKTRDTFPTREDAVTYCFLFGMDIIDGKVEGCTVEGL